MNAALIGISAGVITIFIIAMLKLERPITYALILSGIGFLYVGYTWTDLSTVITTSIQAIFFLFCAYAGVKKNIYFLIAGYFLHGAWDLVYPFFFSSSLIPPHYDMFCLSIDFVMGFYLLKIYLPLAAKARKPGSIIK